MHKKYSESLFPFGIGASFIITLLSIMLIGLMVGLLWKPQGFLNETGGGLVLLAIFLAVLVGPIFYNKKVSRFEKDNIPVKKLDDIGVIQGLRGAFIRMVLYEEGIEIRAFYHRYFIPFDKITGAKMEKVIFFWRIKIETGIAGLPDSLGLSKKQLSEVYAFIKNRIESMEKTAEDHKRGK